MRVFSPPSRPWRHCGTQGGINHQRCVPAYDNADVRKAHDRPNMVGHLHGVFAENRLVLRVGGCQKTKRQEESDDLHAVSCTTFGDSRVSSSARNRLFIKGLVSVPVIRSVRPGPRNRILRVRHRDTIQAIVGHWTQAFCGDRSPWARLNRSTADPGSRLILNVEQLFARFTW